MTKALEAEHRAFRIAEHERDRAVAAEQKTDELRDEIGRLRGTPGLLMDPHLLGALERIAHALERHVELLREGLELLRQLAGEPDANE